MRDSRQLNKYYSRILEALRVAILVCLCVLIWCHTYNRFSIQAWKVPLDYGLDPENSDVRSLFADVKAASEGHILPLIPKAIPELGAPYGANWSDFPGGDELLAGAGGLLTHVMGLFPAVNLMAMLASVLAALAFYATCRALKCEWMWSFAGALVFAFPAYIFAHGLHHLTIIYYWHIPLCLLVCRWISLSGGLEFRQRRFAFALAVAAVTGVQNVYYTNMFVQLALLGGFFQLVRHGKKAAYPAFCVAGAALLVFLVMRTDTFVYHHLHGSNPDAVVRRYQWVEYYSLKISDLIIPPPFHRIKAFAHFAEKYFSEVLVPGEFPPGGYMGFVGIASLGWLIVYSAIRMLRVPRLSLPLEAWQILWIIAYATVGGINGLVASFGFLLFRSTTRYSIFILAIVLLFAVRRLSALLRYALHGELPQDRRRNFTVMAAAAVYATVLALWDQSPPQMTTGEIAENAVAMESDRSFTEKIEASVPKGGMIFQLPVMDFPESPIGGLGAYDHLRPYVFSKHLRYSFGAVKGRPRDAWQHDIEQLGLGQMVAQLEKYGFSGIYVNRETLPDKGTALTNLFKGEGYGDIIQSPLNDLFCVLLHPSPHPVKPPGS